MDSTKRFEILKNFKGWGNPNNAIWFVGIEEGGEWNRKSCADDYKNNFTTYTLPDKMDFNNNNDYFKYVDYLLERNYLPSKGSEFIFFKDNEYSPQNLYKNISAICGNLFEINEEVFNRKYLCKNLKNVQDNIFLTNLYPIGSKNITENQWEQNFPDYKVLFGNAITKDKGSYLIQIKNDRKKLFEKMYSDYKPKIIICHGIKYFEDFKYFFNINEFKEEYLPNYRYLVNSDNKFIVTYHLSYYYNKIKFMKNLSPIIIKWIK